MIKKILLSAYACEPDRGSEPGIGWKWALHLAQNPDYEIHVITRKNNQNKIEAYYKSCLPNNNLYFHYYDLPPTFIWLKKHGFSVNLYYAFWQIGILKLGKKLHEQYRFNMVHHLTFGVFRDVSFLYKIPVPFIFGPVGGGDYTPPQLAIYPRKYRFQEEIRKIVNLIALLNPFLNRMFSTAQIILTKTSATKRLIPEKWQNKTYNRLEIGIDNVISSIPENRNKKTFLYVGRFIYLKGLDLLLDTFKYYLDHYDSTAQLLLIGTGNYLPRIEKFIHRNNIGNQIKIIPWLSFEELKQYYQTSTAFVFPSLHDSSGNVVLEALSFGLPVICLDCGGPAYVMGDTLEDTIIATLNKSPEQICKDFAKKMNILATNESFYNNVAIKSQQRAKEFLWSTVVENSYEFIFNKIEKSNK